MAKYLFIVESPSKAKTINKYLGSDFKVLSSYGHMFELAGKGKGVNKEDNFSLNKVLSPEKKAQMKLILSAAKASECIYLASDPDREGEGIANDLLQYLRANKIKQPIKRATYHEVTQKAVLEAVKNASGVNLNMAEAQNARRGLDYLVGFTISPLLWRRVAQNASAGRVQSPALRLVCERAKEIQEFIPIQYSQFDAVIQSANKGINQLKAQFHRYQDKVGYKLLPDSPIFKAYGGDLNKLEQDLKGITHVTVREVKEKPNSRKPQAPFITSSLQQAAHSRLGFSVDATMSAAQKLFENGYITYHRTDSPILSREFIDNLKSYIKDAFGSQYLAEVERVYKSKNANAQEAHEAIRPTDLKLNPKEAKGVIEDERQYKLYCLIYNRCVASQMADMKTLVTTVHFSDDSQVYGFKVSGSVVTFDGFSLIYKADKKEGEEYELPLFKVGDRLEIGKIIREDKATEPPPRYNDASLVKALEERGIGRPSTYATIIKTLKDREYIEKEGNAFTVTDKGKVVNQFLLKHLPRYVDIDFTANMESILDQIAHGKASYLQTMSSYWKDLHQDTEKVKQEVKEQQSNGNVTNSDKILEVIPDKQCPTCGKGIVKRLGRFGSFLACIDYPVCKTILKEGPHAELVTDRDCPKCHGQLYKKVTRKGNPYIGCGNYPKCDYVEWIDDTPLENRVTCPYCKVGYLRERKSKFGTAYTCNRYPECNSGFIKPKDYEILKNGGSIELTTPEERAARKAAWKARQKEMKGKKKGK